MTDEPSNSEVMRRLDDLMREVREFRASLVAAQDRAEQTYLRKAEFTLAQQTDAAESRGVQLELHKMGKRLENLETSFRAAEKDVADEIDRIEERRRSDVRWALGLVVPLVLGLLLTLAANGAFL